MVNAANRPPSGQAYYTTSYSPRTGTTSTVALRVWKALSDHLSTFGLPYPGGELSEATGVSLQTIEEMFSQEYYQRSYGFRRFTSVEEWRAWAEGEGVLYVPALHDPILPDADGPESEDADSE